MINKFLTAKHWQLFILMFAIPMVIEMVWIFSMIFHVVQNIQNGGEIESMFSFFYFFPVIMIIAMGSLLWWFWSIGSGLQPMIPQELRPNIAFFKVTVLFPIIYFMLFFGIMFNAITGMRPDFYLIILIVPMHLFTMFCMFYNLYFVAKTYKTAELQRKVEFADYIGEFFLLWFYPVGVWFIQPKVNKMVEGKL